MAVIDLKTLEFTSHLDVGGGPDGLAWAILRQILKRMRKSVLKFNRPATPVDRYF